MHNFRIDISDGMPQRWRSLPLVIWAPAAAVGGDGPAGASGITSCSITITAPDLGDFVRVHGGPYRATSVLRHIPGILSLLQARPKPRVPAA